jgi:peroxiredoxin Q/BCP
MPVELRKRKAHQLPAATPAPKKTTNGKAKKVVEKVKEAVKPSKEKKAAAAAAEPKEEEEKKEEEAPAPAAAPAEEKKVTTTDAPASKKVAVGDTITLEGFGGEIETNDGKKTTLKALVDESKSGVVLFTYPKASTPGCEFPLPFLRARLRSHSALL